MNAHKEVYKGHKILIEYDEMASSPFEDWDWPEGLAIVHNDRNTIEILEGDLTCDQFKAMLEGGEAYFIEQYGEDVWIKHQEDDTWWFFNEGHEGNEQLLFRTKGGLTEEEAWEAIGYEFSIDTTDDYYFLPVYKFEHSGIAYNTGGFSCPWDSGQFGYIYISKEDAAKCDWDINSEEKANRYMEGVIETWSQWASGEVYGYIVEKNVSCTCGEHTEFTEEESCWGFFGDMDYCLEVAKSIVDWKVRGELLKSPRKETMYKLTLSYDIEITAQFELITEGGRYCFFWDGYRYFDKAEIIGIEDVGFEEV